MSAERRRLRGVWRRITDDPYRKLVAIGLAVMMWFFIDSRITKTTTREMPLRVAGTSDGEGISVAMPLGIREKGFYAGDEPISRVRIVMTGPRYRIEALEGEPLNLQVTEFLSLSPSKLTGAVGDPKRRFVEFSAASIQLDQRLRDVSIRLEPARVRLEYEVLDRKIVPVNTVDVDIVAGDFSERLRLDTAKYTGDATIVGSPYGFEQLEERTGRMFRVQLEPTGGGQTVRGKLEIIGGEEFGLRIDPPIYLTMELLPQTSLFFLKVPIVVDDLSLSVEQRGKYVADEAVREVSVEVSGDLRSQLTAMSDGADALALQDWAMQNLRLQVYIQRPEAGVILSQEMERRAWLVPVGPLMLQIDRSECLLVDTVVVKLRRQ